MGRRVGEISSLHKIIPLRWERVGDKYIAPYLKLTDCKKITITNWDNVPIACSLNSGEGIIIVPDNLAFAGGGVNI